MCVLIDSGRISPFIPRRLACQQIICLPYLLIQYALPGQMRQTCHVGCPCPRHLDDTLTLHALPARATLAEHNRHPWRYHPMYVRVLATVAAILAFYLEDCAIACIRGNSARISRCLHYIWATSTVHQPTSSSCFFLRELSM